MKAWIPHPEGLELMGPTPGEVRVEVFSGVGEPPSDPADVEFWAPPFLATSEATEALTGMSGLKVVQLLSAGAEVWAGKIPDGVTLCDGQGVHSSSTSEWAMTAILSHVRSFPRFLRAQAERRWDYAPTDELAGKRVLIVGAGDIGEALAARLAPFEVEVTRVARRARPGVHAVGELPELLPHADVVVLIVPLTDATRGMVDAEFLSRMADGALLVNAARGPVVDTSALAAAVAEGRIGAALDVTDPEPLPTDHPLWTLPNVLLTPHVAGSVRGLLPRAYRLVGEQLRRHVDGEPLRNVVSEGY
ncbi:MAG: phosphoglycerate dehydrogenase [Micromonosporaceae bacterium]|nr:phosphoglycerate dehydrogenase [Micromonosporaceae bacterium]